MARKTATTDNVTPLRAKKKLVNMLDDVPAIARYLDRIGAKAKSHRTASISREGQDSYTRDDIATIKLASDGAWHVRFPKFAPTDEEREEIANQIGDYRWPTLMKMKKPTLPRELSDALKAEPQNVFEFRDLSGKVVMYQHRVEDQDGKTYIPWTYWDDEKWRSCEPDEALPLWGLDQIKDHAVAFIHEGAKAARHARRIASLASSARATDELTAEERRELSLHPWLAELQHAAHLGWIGGALSPHRTDWSPLRSLQRAFVVADNDADGTSAVPKISEMLSDFDLDVYCIRFDSHFPVKFDLGDDFFDPESEGKLWEWREKPTTKAQRTNANKRYIGPSFMELLGPATWAVKELPPPSDDEAKKRGRPKGPTFILRERFRDQWVVAKEMDPPLYVCCWKPSLTYDAETFNLRNAPFSGGVKNLAAMLGRQLVVEIDNISYEPGQFIERDYGVIPTLMVLGKRTINTWTPTLIRPVEGPHYDPRPWLEFLEHLLPVEEERREVMRWCATLIARPDIHMTFGLLMVSVTHGVGKTTLGHILSVLVGEHNTSWPSEGQIVDSQFNSWQVRKRLAVCNEIYSGHSWKAYNKLKSVIADKDVEVNEKFQRTYTINNWVHVLALSNSRQALKIEDKDRRFLMPKVTEKLKPPHYWRDFRQWLRGEGYGIILEWARRHVGYMVSKGRFESGEVEPIGPEMHAPSTETKHRAIRDATDEDAVLAMEIGAQAIAMAGERNPFLILMDRMVQEWAATKLGMRRDAEDPKARYAFRRSLTNVREGLENAGLVLARDWQVLGIRHQAFATFDPTSEEGRRAMEKWSELVVAPVAVEQWATTKQLM